MGDDYWQLEGDYGVLKITDVVSAQAAIDLLTEYAKKRGWQISPTYSQRPPEVVPA